MKGLFGLPLWDLLLPARRAAATPPLLVPVARKRPIQERYDALVIEMKAAHDIRVRKWRSSSSGCAWAVHYADGSIARLIESPYPTGPMSCAIFLHEVGHHAIGLSTYKPRCLEEYHAWKWAIESMRARGFRVTEAVERRMAEALGYAVRKARRRGIRCIPPELAPYIEVRRQPRRRRPG